MNLPLHPVYFQVKGQSPSPQGHSVGKDVANPVTSTVSDFNIVEVFMLAFW
jgi:hypothetical protein